MSWSPDDRRIALGGSGGIDILSVADGTTSRLVSFAGPSLVASVAWSPDGRLIAANVVHDPRVIGGSRGELVIVDVIGRTTMSLGSNIGGAHPIWSVKGCLGWPYATVEIWCPGRPLLSLPPFPGSSELVWSPDGARYAINSSEDAAPGAIRTYAADGTGQVDLGNRRAFNMQWGGDGRNILFQRLDDKFGEVWVEPVGGGPAAELLSGGFPFAVNGIDDGVVFDTGHALGHNTIWSMSVSNRAQHELASVSAAGGSVDRLTWARDGSWLLVDTVPPA